MARSVNNIATWGLSGQVGQFVFKQRYGKTFASRVPDMSRVKPSAAQIENRRLFRSAAAWAKCKIDQPGMKEYYLAKAKPGQTAYNVIFAEMFAMLKAERDKKNGDT